MLHLFLTDLLIFKVRLEILFSLFSISGLSFILQKRFNSRLEINTRAFVLHARQIEVFIVPLFEVFEERRAGFLGGWSLLGFLKHSQGFLVQILVEGYVLKFRKVEKTLWGFGQNMHMDFDEVFINLDLSRVHDGCNFVFD